MFTTAQRHGAAQNGQVMGEIARNGPGSNSSGRLAVAGDVAETRSMAGEVLTEEEVFIGGLEKRPIVIAAYRPEWVARFAFERDRIVAALGGVAVRVEHVGSTSVPGLGAKPIVDILVAVPDIADDAGFVTPLVAAGFVVRVRERGVHWMFRTPEKDVHVHVCGADEDWEHRHLLFRDWLRHDPADRAAYEAAKRALALVDWPSTTHYSAAKGTIIAEITARARPWAAATGWTVPPRRS
jgi:GrpB-like predicted nucleotidyltransferase (UPF0157 family)